MLPCEPKPSTLIRPATFADIDRLVEIHTSALPGDLLPRLGSAYLRKQFYPCSLRSANAVTLVNDHGGQVDAFIVFAINSGAFTEELKRDRLRIIFSVLQRSLRDPGLGWELASLNRGARIEIARPMGRIQGLPELYLMATHPQRQRTGLGKPLVKAGLLLLSQKGLGACIVKTSSPQARAFYRSLGFEDIGTERRAARSLFLMCRTTDDE